MAFDIDGQVVGILEQSTDARAGRAIRRVLAGKQFDAVAGEIDREHLCCVVLATNNIGLPFFKVLISSTRPRQHQQTDPEETFRQGDFQ